MTSCGEHNARRLREGWLQFLQRYEWSHLGTLTTDHVELSRDGFERQFLHRFTRILARRAQRPLHWFAVIEGDPHADRRTHLHFVIGGTSQVSIKQMEAAWSLGQSKILRFDETRGGLRYLTKTIREGTDAVLISRRLEHRQPRSSTIDGGTGETARGLPPISLRHRDQSLRSHQIGRKRGILDRDFDKSH